MSSATAVRDELQPLRAALLAAADRDVDGRLRAARQEADAVATEAGEEEARRLAEARRAGEADVAAELHRRRVEARRRARQAVLAAQRQAYEQLRTAAEAAVRPLLDDPGRRGRLVAVASRRLGIPDAAASVAVHPGGGVVVTAPDGRQVDVSVPALVAEVLGRVDVHELWTAPA